MAYEDYPKLLYRGMSQEEYDQAKERGYFESHHMRYNYDIPITQLQIDLKHTYDPEDRELIESEIMMLENEMQARDLSGEFDYTFWSDTYSGASGYGPVVVTIRTKGIEHLFAPYPPPGRPGEWVSTQRVPFSAMHGAQLQIKRTQFETRALRRPDVRVHRHLRRLK